MKIIQLFSFQETVDTGYGAENRTHLLGFGDDGLVYEWVRSVGEWRLYK